MTSVVGQVDIQCAPIDVFAYISEPARRPEWQENVERFEVERARPDGLGTRVRETRCVSGRSMTATWEVNEYDLARRYGLRGVDGPGAPRRGNDPDAG